MQETAFLIGMAQLALVLTGLIGIFVVFLIGEGPKSRVNPTTPPAC